MPFRDTIRNLAPPWLLEQVGEGVLYAKGMVFDVLQTWLSTGIQARFPDSAPEDALGYIGNDRQLDRGPWELASTYRVRLRKAFDHFQTWGNAETMIRQLVAFFNDSGYTPAIRTVTDKAVWHEYDWGTGAVNRTKVTPSNWKWDAQAGTFAKRNRGWVIIDSTAGPWARVKWGGYGVKWGMRNRPWGSNATKQEVQSIRNLIRKWKPAHINCLYVLVVFDPSLFERTDTAPPNPNSNYDTPYAWNQGATYWPVGV